MATRTRTRSAARDAVFDTAELLENILRRLPAPTLLLIRRVRRSWNTAILTSPPLRRALFLAPLPPHRVPPLWAIHDQTHELRLYASLSEHELDLWASNARLSRRATLNPLVFTRLMPAARRESLAWRARFCEPVYFVGRPDLARVRDVVLAQEEQQRVGRRMDPYYPGAPPAPAPVPVWPDTNRISSTASARLSSALATPLPCPLNPSAIQPIHYEMYLTQPPTRVVELLLAYHRNAAQHTREDATRLKLQRRRQQRSRRRTTATTITHTRSLPSTPLTPTSTIPVPSTSPHSSTTQPHRPAALADAHIPLTVTNASGVRFGDLLARIYTAITAEEREIHASLLQDFNSKESSPAATTTVPSLRAREELGDACVAWMVGAVFAEE